MIYLDTSCLLKLLLEESESAAVRTALARRVHCRTLDRLHLAAMEELSLRRLMTTDTAQAAGGKALGFEVVSPGR
jgi:predicted nucleic acid-binding protein